MRAIILDSGTGSRMKDLTKDKPKCLVELVDGETILGRQIRILQDNQIDQLVITTGPFEDLLQKYVAKQFPSAKPQYVNKPTGTGTNYIYSLYLARGIISSGVDNVILMHGDLVFDEQVLPRLIDYDYPNGVLVSRNIVPPEKDFKCRVKDEVVTEIRVDISGQDCHFLAPLYKLSQESLGLWLDEIARFVERGETKVYAENAFNGISRQVKLKPVYCDGLFCMEIDDPDDLKLARKYLSTG